MTDVFPCPQNPRVLLLPGWLNSDAAHWQSRWEVLHGYTRVEQDDWTWPRRGDWMARLDEVIQQQDTARVVAAWLVAPPDTEREDTPPNLFNWRPMVRSKLPFASRVLASSDDPYCALERSEGLARDWGSSFENIGVCGHINGDSGLGDWSEGQTGLVQWWARLGREV